MRSIRFYVLFLLFTIVGCNGSHRQTGLITDAGMYPSPDNKYELVVTFENHFAFYEIRAAGTVVPLTKGRVGSAFHQFALMWDDKNNVLISGEDTARVIFFEEGKFRTHDKTVADFKDPNFPKPPAEWNEPAHR